MRPTALFLPYPSAAGTWGSTVKLVVLADELRRRGGRAVFHAPGTTGRLLKERGYEVLPLAGAPPRPGRHDIDSFYDVCHALGFDDRAFLDQVLASEADAVDRVRPDLLVSHLRPTAPVTAARFGLPLAACASWCTDPRGQARPAGDPLDDLAARFAADRGGLRVGSMAELVSARADLQLATSFPVFEPELEGTQGLVYTGILRDPPDPGRATGDAGDAGDAGEPPDRLVLGYASTAPWCVPSVVAAFDAAARAAGVVVWLVGTADGPAGPRSDHCRLFRYLDFDALQPRACGVVFHGGQGTALAALAGGVPTVAFPGRHYERRYNADRLAELGAGVAAELTELRPDRLREHLERLADDEDLRRAAAAVPVDADRYRGAPTAVDALLRLT